MNDQQEGHAAGSEQPVKQQRSPEHRSEPEHEQDKREYASPGPHFDHAGELPDPIADAHQERVRVPIQDSSEVLDGPDSAKPRTRAGGIPATQIAGPSRPASEDTLLSGESGDVVVDRTQETFEDDSAQHAEDSTQGLEGAAPTARESN